MLYPDRSTERANERTLSNGGVRLASKPKVDQCLTREPQTANPPTAPPSPDQRQTGLGGTSAQLAKQVPRTALRPLGWTPHSPAPASADEDWRLAQDPTRQRGEGLLLGARAAWRARGGNLHCRNRSGTHPRRDCGGIWGLIGVALGWDCGADGAGGSARARVSDRLHVKPGLMLIERSVITVCR